MQKNSFEVAHPQLGSSYEVSGPTDSGSVIRSVLHDLHESCDATAVSGGAVLEPVGFGLPDNHADPVGRDGLRLELAKGLMTVLAAGVLGMLFKQLADSYRAKRLMRSARSSDAVCTSDWPRLRTIFGGFGCCPPRRIRRGAC